MSEKKIKETREKIVLAALVVAQAQGWTHTSLRDIAVEAKLSLAELYSMIEDKDDVLRLLGRMIDARVMEGAPQEPSGSSREVLFDLMMDRYEVLNEYRAGLVAILESFKCDPKQWVVSAPHLCRSMGWMLEAAGIETSGIKGAVKVAGLSAVYLKVLRVWVEDESADLAKVMAALDKDLGRAEGFAEMVGF